MLDVNPEKIVESLVKSSPLSLRYDVHSIFYENLKYVSTYVTLSLHDLKIKRRILCSCWLPAIFSIVFKSKVLEMITELSEKYDKSIKRKRI